MALPEAHLWLSLYQKFLMSAVLQLCTTQLNEGTQTLLASWS